MNVLVLAHALPTRISPRIASPTVTFFKLPIWRVSLDPKELYKLENGDLPVALAVGQLAIAFEGSTERTRRYYYDRWLRIQFVSRLHLG